MKPFGYVLLVFFLRSSESRRMPAAAARRLLERMNRDVDPCENFYEYACGGFLANNEVEPDAFSTGTFPQLELNNDKRVMRLLGERIRLTDSSPVKKAKLFYQSCLNQDEIEANAISQILEFINAEGGSWPTFNSSWDESDFDLELSMAAANRINTVDSGSVGPLIRVLVVRGILGPEFHMALSDTGFGIGNEEYITDTLELLGADRATAETDAKDLYNLNLLTAQLPMKTALLGVSVGDLMNFPGTFDWMKFLTNVFRETDYTVNESDSIFVNVNDYYEAVVPELNAASKRVVANLVKWRMFLSLLQASPAAVINRRFQERAQISGQEEDIPRERFCAKVVNGDRGLVPDTYGMTQIVARMLIDRYYMRKEKWENFRIAQLEEEMLKDILSKNDWLSTETKLKLINKVGKVSVGMVYPNTTFDDDYLENFYNDFEINEDSYVKNFISTLLGNTRRSLENLLYPERFKWVASASIVNGVMSYFQPQLIVTAALLQDPMYDLSFPWAIKYGAGGFITGHEFTHLIGSRNNNFDADGVYLFTGDYMSDASFGIFVDEKLICLINQYNQYDIPYTDGLTVNGVSSLEENLADNVGAKIAYLTYDRILKKYGERKITNLPFTSRELFFIGFAQAFCEKRRPEYATVVGIFGNYSPEKWRINGPLRNLPEFSEVFKCPSDSFMNLEERCTVY